MENQNNINQLLADLKLDNLQDSDSQNELMIKELEKDAKAYQGLGIKILSIIGGILASGFFFGFLLLLMGGWNYTLLFVGLITIVAAIVVDKVVDSIVVDSFCVCSFLVGCFLVGFSVSELTNSRNITTLVILAIALLTILCTSAKVFNLFAVLAINGCLYAFININDIYLLFHLLTAFLTIGFTILSLYEANFLTYDVDMSRRYGPFRTGFMISLLVMLFHFVIRWRDEIQLNWISSVVLILASLFVVYQLVMKLEVEKQRLIIFGVSLAVLGSSIFAPAICGAILLILVSFYVSYHLGTTIGIFALVYFVGQFYYDLSFTLLHKSIMMILTGILFLAAWFIFRKQLERDFEKVDGS